MKTFTFSTERICPRTIQFTLDGDKIFNVKFSGGCSGNLQAVSRLVEGRTVNEIYSKLNGISCGNKGTSCPDQLAKSIKRAYDSMKSSENC